MGKGANEVVRENRCGRGLTTEGIGSDELGVNAVGGS